MLKKENEKKWITSRSSNQRTYCQLHWLIHWSNGNGNGNRIMKDRVGGCFFSYVFFPNISVSPASKKFLQIPSSRTNIGRLWNSMETGGTCCPVPATGTPSRGWKKHLPSFTKNSGANHHWHRIWGLTISLRWQQIAVRFLKKWWWFHADTFICRGCILLWCQKKKQLANGNLRPEHM